MNPVLGSFRRSWFLLLLLWATVSSGPVIGADVGGPLFFKAWQTENGLPNNTVVSVAQTPDGYLWVATDLGLFRFDGIRFQRLTAATDAGLPTSIIRAMLLDHKGWLWLAKDRGALVCLDRGKIVQTFTPKDGLSIYQTRSMAEDKEGNIWLGDSQGHIFFVRDGKVKQFGIESGLSGQGVCWLASDLDGQLWISQGGRVGVMRKGHFEVGFTLKADSVLVQSARAGGVWLCAGKQIYRSRDGASPECFAEPLPIKAGVKVTALYQDRQGRLWVGTASEGLFYWDTGGWQKAPTSHPSILSITEDAEGNLWVGTMGGGLNRLRTRAIELAGLNSGLPFDAVQSVCQDASGAIWAVGQNGLLARRSKGTWSLVSGNSGWPGGRIECVAAAPDGTVYVGTRDNAVFGFTNGVFVPLGHTDKLGTHFIRLLTVSTNGDLWIGPDFGRYFFRYRNDALTSFELPVSVHLRAMVEDCHGDMWVATGEGYLVKVHDGALVDETSKTLATPYPIRTLHATDDGSIWIGYAGHGLGRLKDGQFLQVRVSDGLWDDYISQIISDDQGQLWLAGNRGIFYVALKDFDELGSGRVERVRSVVVGQGEGLPNLQAAFDFWPNAFRSRDGNLLMSMLSGLAIVHPIQTTAKTPLPPVSIEQVTVNEQLVAAYDNIADEIYTNGNAADGLRDLAQPLRVAPGVRQMEIEYTALSFTAPENLEFRYRLKGLNSDWVQAGQRRIAYFGVMAPGNYTFRVQARTYDGEWNDVGASLAFTVVPYIWQTWWFKIGGFMILLVVGGGGIRYVERRRLQHRLELLEHEHAVERERARIAKDIHDELGSHLTGITILSDLAQSADAPSHEIQADVRKIGDVSRELTRSLAEIVWAVNPREDSLESFVTYACHFAEEYLRPAGVRCFLEVPEKLPAHELTTEIRHNLFMVVKEVLNNVVKHARASQVQIRIAMDGDCFQLRLEDNGCGFEVATVASTGESGPRSTRRSTGNGLENMRQRIESIGGQFRLHSAPGQGTWIELELVVSPRRIQSGVTPFAYFKKKAD